MKELWRLRTGSPLLSVNALKKMEWCFRVAFGKRWCVCGCLGQPVYHNPSSTTSLTSFQGTGISLFQLTEPGESWRPVMMTTPSGNEKHILLDSYASAPAVALKTTAVAVRRSSSRELIRCGHSWVEHALPLLETEELTTMFLCNPW